MIGTSLGPYKIIEQLGAGGMGEVYLGEDTRLGRKVAIKVLPAEFASDPERLARFEQEARAAAALNHPHIAVVHDIGAEQDADGATTHFMVQEYLEGQSLRQRLDKGAVPLDKALDLATEIGEALVAAHKAGIIHRDLKPDNIFVTEEGHAKVLDFGLAKLVEVGAPIGSELSMSPTVLGTVAGQVMGTAGYMAPEQANGEEVDQRADLFAFGCVLYAMVTGLQAFGGKNVHETLGHILSDEPAPMAEIDNSLPVELQRIVRKLLAKETERRYQTAGDLNIDLRQLKDDIVAGAAPGQRVATPLPVAPVVSRPLARLAPWGVATLALLVAAWAVIGTTRPGSSSAPMFLPLGQFPTASTGSKVIDISPDGRRVVFVGDGQLQLLDLGTPEAVPVPIPGTERAINPFYSHNGEWIGFHAGGSLQRVRPGGGPPTTIAEDVQWLFGARWGSDDRIVFTSSYGGPVRIVSSGAGEQPTPLATPDASGGIEHSAWPSLLPGGTHLLASEYGNGWNVVVRSLDSGDEVLRVDGGFDARYLDSGHLLYASDGALLARTLDLESLNVGDPQVVVDNVVVDFGNGFGSYGLAAAGTLAYLEGTEEPTRQLIRIATEDGSRTLIREERDYYASLTLSPDGTQMALTLRGAREQDSQLAHIDVARGILTRLTSGRGDWVASPVFDQAGERILYSNVSNPSYFAVHTRAGEEERVAGSEGIVSQVVSWRSDETIAFADESRESDSVGNIGILSPGGEGPEVLVQATRSLYRAPRFSPGEAHVAFTSDFYTDPHVYVVPYPRGSADQPWLVSPDGGKSPRWSGDGSKLYFWRDNTIYVTDVLDTAPFRTSRAEVFLEQIDADWDIAADGSFVVTRNVQELPRMRIILNFFEELERLVPTGR